MLTGGHYSAELVGADISRILNRAPSALSKGSLPLMGTALSKHLTYSLLVPLRPPVCSNQAALRPAQRSAPLSG
jgi:hypothetical protein